ncbi:RNA-binding protein 44 [Brachionichthys hirsutus]|uniref:RNA-binding protein 44 n=1 Tax=Brachionichthys hirsutus TaxID=412623 RepID=UPI0036048740
MAWPCFPLALPYQVIVPTPSYVANDYPAGSFAVVPSYDTAEIHTSIFELVNSHSCLDLTGQTLRCWYLNLSPEDKTIIQDEGGFQQFLQRHPALELLTQPVYVKYVVGRGCPVLPPVLPPVLQPDSPAQTSAAPGERERRLETDEEHLRLEMLPSNVREALLCCDDGGDCLQNGPEQEVHYTQQLGCPQDCCQSGFSGPPTLEPSQQRAQEEEPFPLNEDRSPEPDRRGREGRPEDWTQILPRSAAERKPPADPAAGEASLISEDQSDVVLSIMEADGSILACLKGEGAKRHDGGLLSGPAGPDGLAATASSETIRRSTAETSTCDASVGPETPPPPPNTPASTQTEDPGTADKQVLTDVHMADLDYLAKAFMKRKLVKGEEPKERQEKANSWACTLRKERERAQKAELRLLALQQSLCRQQCLGLFYTSEGGQFTPFPNEAPGQVLSVLQQLERDYNEMRAQILAGVPLEQLEPLSVGSDAPTPGGSHVPAEISADMPGPVPSRKRALRPKTLKRGEPSPQSPGTAVRPRTSRRPVGDEPCRFAQEPNASEAWYDAQEDLEPSGPAEATGMEGDTTAESSGEEAQSSVLHVSNPPNNVTEEDVKLWFENFQVSEVGISASRSGVRVAVVTVKGAQSAEAAARELNGRIVRGSALLVERITGTAGGGAGGLPPSRDSDQSAQTSNTGSGGVERKLMTEPPLGADTKARKVVCVSPTVKETFVPRHYGTMDSFDALMAELAERHPEVGRQAIASALTALSAKHQGRLCSLPLKAIREMTSDLLM